MLFKELWRLLLLKYLFLQRMSLWRIFEHQGIYIKKHQLTSQRRNKTPLKSGAHSLCRKNQIHNSPLDHIELWVMSSLWIGCVKLHARKIKQVETDHEQHLVIEVNCGLFAIFSTLLIYQFLAVVITISTHISISVSPGFSLHIGVCL